LEHPILLCPDDSSCQVKCLPGFLIPSYLLDTDPEMIPGICIVRIDLRNQYKVADSIFKDFIISVHYPDNFEYFTMIIYILLIIGDEFNSTLKAPLGFFEFTHALETETPVIPYIRQIWIDLESTVEVLDSLRVLTLMIIEPDPLLISRLCLTGDTVRAQESPQAGARSL
jgi:hypothetical protein